MKVQARRRQDTDAIKEHGDALEQAIKRMVMHTRTLPHVTEAAGMQDRRIIVQESQAIMARTAAILAILAQGGE